MTAHLATPDRPAVRSPAGSLVISPILGRAPLRLQVVALLLVLSAVSWRSDTYYSGGVDPVVAAKAGLTFVALAIALTTRPAPGAWARFRGAPVLWLGAYLVVSSVGALVVGNGLASIVLAVRLALVAVIVLAVVLTHRWYDVVNAFTAAMMVLAVVGAATGIPNLLSSGRLHAGIPDMHANEVCYLAAVPLVALVWAAVNDHGPQSDRWAILPLLGIVAATGSRTGAAGLLVVVLLVVVTAPRIPVTAVVATVLAAPAAFLLTFYTSVVLDFAARGDLSQVGTLSSRTVAWKAAMDYPDSASSRWFGEGLAVREIPVRALYRDEQILDSAWVSALVQAGVIGTALLAIFVLVTLLRASILPAPYRSLAVGMLGLVTMASFLESGMFDTKPAFIVFFCTALLVHRAKEKS